MADEKAEKQAEKAPKSVVDETEPGSAVTSTTTNVTHPADASSAPGPYEDLPIERPGVSTAKSDGDVAQSLVAGAGAPQTEGQSSPAEG